MQKENNLGYWYNYRTQQYEHIETPTDFSDYVPQIGGRGLYQLYVEHYQMMPAEAAMKVLAFAACVKE